MRKRTARPTPAVAAGALLLAALAAACAGPPTLPQRPEPLARSDGVVVAPEDGAEAPAADPTDPGFEFLRATELEREGRLEEALLAYERVLALDPAADVLRRMAELSLALNRPQEAFAYGKRAWDAGADDLALRLFLGARHAQARDRDAMREVLLDAEGEPVSAEAAVLLYGADFMSGDFAAARDTAVWLEDHEPDRIRGTLALSAALEAMEQPDTAERILRAGLERHPGDLRLYGALAESRRNRGDRLGEIGIHREALAHHPDHQPTLIAKAEAELALGRRDEAIASLEAVEADHPDDLRATLRLAFLDYEDGDWAAARDRFERAHRAFPDQTEIAFFLGVSQLQSGDEEGAFRTFDDIAPGQDRFADAQLQIANLYEARGDLPRALDSVERALAEEPRREVQLYRATLLSRLGDRETALLYLEDLLAESPDDADVMFQMGILHQEAGEREDALAWMERALEKDDGHPGALNFIGYSMAERGEDLDEAEQLIVRALERRPDDGYIADSLGWVYYQRAQPLLAHGHRDEALRWLQRAESELLRAEALSGGDPVISEHLGDVYRALGRDREALARYEEAAKRGLRPVEQPQLEQKLEALREGLAQP